MNIYKVKLTYRFFDIVEVEADNVEDALEKAPALSDDAHFEIHEDSKVLSVEEAGESDEDNTRITERL